MFKTKKSDNLDYGPIRFLKTSGLSLFSVDEAAIRLSPFVCNQIVIGQGELKQAIGKHLREEIIESGKKLGLSIGFLGSPRTLYDNLGSGVSDFIFDPLEGWNQQGILGATKGSLTGATSLIKNTTIGLTSSINVLNSSLSQLCLLVNWDKDYQRFREDKLLVYKPDNFVEGFGYGCESIVSSCKAGVFGLFSRPYIEAKRTGFRGFMHGTYQGLTGVLLKPASGFLDCFAKSSEGIKNTVRVFDRKTNRGRLRNPRPFYGL